MREFFLMILDNFGQFWMLLEAFGKFWTHLDDFMTMLDHFGPILSDSDQPTAIRKIFDFDVYKIFLISFYNFVRILSF